MIEGDDRAHPIPLPWPGTAITTTFFDNSIMVVAEQGGESILGTTAVGLLWMLESSQPDQWQELVRLPSAIRGLSRPNQQGVALITTQDGYVLPFTVKADPHKLCPRLGKSRRLLGAGAEVLGTLGPNDADCLLYEDDRLRIYHQEFAPGSLIAALRTQL